MSFFEVNLDYVYFLAGLSAMGLGAAASLLVIERDRSMRWIMLAAFGILAGLASPCARRPSRPCSSSAAPRSPRTGEYPEPG
jgi:hypothetical protein